MSGVFTYDTYFQQRILAVALSSESNLRSLVGIVEPHYFTTKHLSYAWKVIQQVYLKEGIRLSPDTLCMLIGKKDVIPSEQIDSFREELKTDCSDSEIILKEVAEFCKKAAFLSTIAGSIEDINKGSYDVLFEKFEKIFSTDFEQTDVGADYFKEAAQRSLLGEENMRGNLVPMGLDLDQYCGGGLGAKELGIILAPPARGKTAMLLNLAYHAYLKGKTVLYVSCELSEAVLQSRMDHIIMGSMRDIQEFLPDELISTLKQIQKGNKGKIRFKEFCAGELTVPQLYSFIKTAEALTKEKYDVIFIDYLGEMKIPRAEREDIAYKNLVTQLRGLAFKLEVPVWTAHQGNRGSHDKLIMRHTDVADSFGLFKPPDIVISLSANAIEDAAGYRRATFLKNRFGPPEVTVTLRFDGRMQKFFVATPLEMKEASERKGREMGSALGLLSDADKMMTIYSDKDDD